MAAQGVRVDPVGRQPSHDRRAVAARRAGARRLANGAQFDLGTLCSMTEVELSTDLAAIGLPTGARGRAGGVRVGKAGTHFRGRAERGGKAATLGVFPNTVSKVGGGMIHQC